MIYLPVIYYVFRRLVGSGDAGPSKWALKVEKGEYVLKVHIRQEKRELLDRSDPYTIYLYMIHTYITGLFFYVIFFFSFSGFYLLKIVSKSRKSRYIYLHRFTETPLLLSSKLSSAVTLDVYSSHSEAIGRIFNICTVRARELCNLDF